MTVTKQHGVLSISLDLPSEDPSAMLAGGQDALDVVRQLIRWHQHYQIPATWAASDLDSRRLTALLLDASPRHEVVLLADPSWASHEAGRTRFAHELGQRLAAARRLRCRIGCLALRDGASVEHLDLLVKHRIRLIRDWKECSGRADPVRQESVRYGLWRIRPSVTLARPSRWRWPGPVWTAKRMLVGVITRGTLAHVRVDVGRLLDERSPSLREYERFLAFVSKRCRQGALHALTLGQLSGTLEPAFQGGPGRSILRPAA